MSDISVSAPGKMKGISSAWLHIIAMILMLFDHMWATLFLDQKWMTCIGRIAFPIFAFMIVEGLTYTHNTKKYLIRLLIAAIISEIPFNLMYNGTVIYPFHQNVIWTFLMAALLILMIEKAKETNKLWLTILASSGAIILGTILGTVTMVDYYGAGVVTVLIFYFFKKRNWISFIGQLVCLYYLNVEMIGGYYYDINIFGHSFELVEQGLAILALVPIWLYQGKQGYHAKWFKYFCYGFYPVHMLVLYLLYVLI